jgi:hypothetical protein
MTLPLLAALLVLAPGAVAPQRILARPAQVATMQVRAKGSTLLQARFAGRPVTIAFLTHQVPIGSVPGPEREFRKDGCTYGRIPCSVLDSLVIRVAGERVYIPRSAVIDLGDIGSASLRTAGSGRYLLTLDCGDASESYAAKIVFDRHRVLRRTLIDGESRELLEQTVYFGPPVM